MISARRAVAIAVLLIAVSTAGVSACTGALAYGPARSPARAHPLEWTVHVAGEVVSPVRKDNRGLLADATACNRDAVDLLRGLVRAAVRSGALVLLGEVHDNPHHHHVRGHLISLLGARPGLVLEHLRADQKPALDLFEDLARNGSHLNSTSQFFRAVKWEGSGWPDKAIFEPLIRAGLKQRLPILPGDPSRETVRSVAKQGRSALAPDELAALKLDEPLEALHEEALLTELEASHCGLVPKAAFVNMALAQRYRDAHLARALVQAAEKHGAAILLTGNGHVRADRGVPHYLRLIAPERRIMTVVLSEVEAGRTEPASAITRDDAGRPVADFTLFTPRVARKDPCIEMRAQFGRKP